MYLHFDQEVKDFITLYVCVVVCFIGRVNTGKFWCLGYFELFNCALKKTEGSSGYMLGRWGVYMIVFMSL